MAAELSCVPAEPVSGPGHCPRGLCGWGRLCQSCECPEPPRSRSTPPQIPNLAVFPLLGASVNYLQGMLNWAFAKQGAAQFNRKACCIETVLCFKILIRLIFPCTCEIGDTRRPRFLWVKVKPSPTTTTSASTRGHLHLASA